MVDSEQTKELRHIAKRLKSHVEEIDTFIDRVEAERPRGLLPTLNDQTIYCLKDMINEHPLLYNITGYECVQHDRDGFGHICKWETFIELLAHRLIVGVDIDGADFRTVVYTISDEGRKVVREWSKLYCARADKRMA